LFGHALLEHVRAIRMSDIHDRALESDVALLIEADSAQHRVELAAVHRRKHGTEVEEPAAATACAHT
jgi:hypothetical protein